jgi:sec-independent protein translocase protein TatA
MVSYQDLLLGLVLLLLLFGAKRLPELAGSLGESMKAFKKAVSGEAADDGPSANAGLRSTGPSSASPMCAACGTPLERDWSHCPRCGASAPRTDTGSSSAAGDPAR